jgi:hypothetical protein
MVMAAPCQVIRQRAAAILILSISPRAKRARCRRRLDMGCEMAVVPPASEQNDDGDNPPRSSSADRTLFGPSPPHPIIHGPWNSRGRGWKPGPKPTRGRGSRCSPTRAKTELCACSLSLGWRCDSGRMRAGNPPLRIDLHQGSAGADGRGGRPLLAPPPRAARTRNPVVIPSKDGSHCSTSSC